MTVAALAQTRAQIAGDGVTDRVDVTFQFVDENDLRVIHTDVDGTDTEWIYGQSPGSWGFTGGGYATGTVTFNAADLATGERLTVVATSEYSQPVSFSGGEMDPDVIQKGLDRAALQIQAIAGDVSRTLRVSASYDGETIDLEVPDLPDGYGFAREGDALVPVPIDSALITDMAAAVQEAKAGAEEAQSNAAASAASAAESEAAAENSAAIAAAAAGTLNDSYVSRTQTSKVNADTLWYDGKFAKFGTDNDLLIGHHSDLNAIAVHGSGSLYIHHLVKSQDIYLQGSYDDGSTDGVIKDLFKGVAGQYVSLYYVGAERMRTDSSGIRVYGNYNDEKAVAIGAFGSTGNGFVGFYDLTTGNDRYIKWNQSEQKLEHQDSNGEYHDMLSIGQDQTWQNVVGSRSTNTSYQNTTGRPIALSIRWSAASGRQLQLSANGSSWVGLAQTNTSTGNTVFAIVPAGHYYRISGTATIALWAELR